jgi:hypothetical protein
MIQSLSAAYDTWHPGAKRVSAGTGTENTFYAWFLHFSHACTITNQAMRNLGE